MFHELQFALDDIKDRSRCDAIVAKAIRTALAGQ